MRPNNLLLLVSMFVINTFVGCNSVTRTPVVQSGDTVAVTPDGGVTFSQGFHKSGDSELVVTANGASSHLSGDGVSPVGTTTVPAPVEIKLRAAGHQDAAKLVKEQGEADKNFAEATKEKSQQIAMLGVGLFIFGVGWFALGLIRPELSYPTVAAGIAAVGGIVWFSDGNPWFLLLLIAAIGFYLAQKFGILKVT